MFDLCSYKSTKKALIQWYSSEGLWGKDLGRGPICCSPRVGGAEAPNDRGNKYKANNIDPLRVGQLIPGLI